jgi:hypothetical protein
MGEMSLELTRLVHLAIEATHQDFGHTEKRLEVLIVVECTAPMKASDAGQQMTTQMNIMIQVGHALSST